MTYCQHTHCGVTEPQACLSQGPQESLPLRIDAPQILTPTVLWWLTYSTFISDLPLRCLPVCFSAYSLDTRSAYTVPRAEVPSCGSKVLAIFFLLRKIHPELTSVTNLPLVCMGTATTAWALISQWCRYAPRNQSPGRGSEHTKLNH